MMKPERLSAGSYPPVLFNSAIFALFMALLLPAYAALRWSTARKWLLLVASYLFYAHWDYRYLSLLVLSTGVDYAIGQRLHRSNAPRTRRLLLLTSLTTNLGLLAVFKYGNFLLGNLQPLFDALEVQLPVLPENIPVGISFYTFQTLSYTLDIYRRQEKPARSPLEFALFVSFFGQLVAGPIVRSREFLPQIRELRDLRAENVSSGLRLFILGLFKKVVIADNAGLFVNTVFATPGEYSAFTLWAASYGFALQIYCDFSGYTDMALGIARAFGLKLPRNFDAPYLSSSITEFWRRWHMSLSRWLRDYLYIPLGGSRGSARRTYINLLLTMLLGGLWHGAAWTFVLWGGFHGLLLAIERYRGERRPLGSLARIAGVLVTFHLTCLAWVMFRSDGFESLGTYVVRMFTAWGTTDSAGFLPAFWTGVMLLLLVVQYVTRRFALREFLVDRLPAPALGLGIATLVLLIGWFHVDDVAFIYFQF